MYPTQVAFRFWNHEDMQLLPLFVCIVLSRLVMFSYHLSLSSISYKRLQTHNYIAEPSFVPSTGVIEELNEILKSYPRTEN